MGDRFEAGRFCKRPHYEPAELDAECESLVSEFLRGGRGRLQFPISTDDLTVLLEAHVADGELYGDTSGGEGEDVEGVTDFYPGKKPRVRISKHLSIDPRAENRFRTTLTHELTHVRFHAFMFDVERPGSLFEAGVVDTNKCRRDSIIGRSPIRLDGVASRIWLRCFLDALDHLTAGR